MRESLVLGRTLERAGDRGIAVSRALVLLGRALSEQGHVEEAMAVLKEALAELRGSGMTGFTSPRPSSGSPTLVATTGDPLRAARLFGAADASWRASGATRYPLDDQAYERDVQAVKDQLDDHTIRRSYGRGTSDDRGSGHRLRASRSLNSGAGQNGRCQRGVRPPTAFWRWQQWWSPRKSARYPQLV